MSTVDRADDAANALAHELVGAFCAFGPAFGKWVSAGFRERGITFARMRLLHVLHDEGPQIMSGLRDRLGVTARNVTALVDALEADDLVRRAQHPTDRRATIIELTEAGRGEVDDAFGAHTTRASALFARLSASDQRELLRIIRQLSEEIHDLAAAEGVNITVRC